MSIIRLLPESLKNKIAAGEVVERPASIVKELMENSLDAGATSIEVDIDQGGVRRIRVADNGCGMNRDDALMCLKRHATSKLGSEDDLFNIKTLGFRGEALPSIASVTKLTLISAPKDAAHGVKIELVGGEVQDVRDWAGVGTVIEARELFFNTPARRKFLKRQGTELTHIIDTFTEIGLAYPGVALTLKADAKPLVELARASSIRERVMQLYGTEFLEVLVEVKFQSSAMQLTGLASRPTQMRERKGHQFVFINHRPIKAPVIARAVYDAYFDIAPRDRHPVYFLSLTLEPQRIDCNVHPAKREVRFADSDSVYRFVRRAIDDAVRVRARMDEPQQAQTPEPNSFQMRDIAYPESTAPPASFLREAVEPLARPTDMPLPDFRPARRFLYLGESFVAFVEGGGLQVVDHHAAHERVLYEKFLAGLKHDVKGLLFPRQVQLSKKEHMAVLEHSAVLAEFGIEVEDFGRDTVLVRTVPGPMSEADLRGVLSDVAHEVMQGQKPGVALKEALAARVACHASVRGSVVLTDEAMEALLRDLARCNDPEHCPHGRPTRMRLTLDDLRKQFRRK